MVFYKGKHIVYVTFWRSPGSYAFQKYQQNFTASFADIIILHHCVCINPDAISLARLKASRNEKRSNSYGSRASIKVLKGGKSFYFTCCTLYCSYSMHNFLTRNFSNVRIGTNILSSVVRI